MICERIVRKGLVWEVILGRNAKLCRRAMLSRKVTKKTIVQTNAKMIWIGENGDAAMRIAFDLMVQSLRRIGVPTVDSIFLDQPAIVLVGDGGR